MPDLDFPSMSFWMFSSTGMLQYFWHISQLHDLPASSEGTPMCLLLCIKVSITIWIILYSTLKGTFPNPSPDYKSKWLCLRHFRAFLGILFKCYKLDVRKQFCIIKHVTQYWLDCKIYLATIVHDYHAAMKGVSVEWCRHWLILRQNLPDLFWLFQLGLIHLLL